MSSAKPVLLEAAAATESSSALPGADDVGDVCGSAWRQIPIDLQASLADAGMDAKLLGLLWEAALGEVALWRRRRRSGVRGTLRGRIGRYTCARREEGF